ncbi:MAG TPA: PEGA domain-containing protein, partial [Terriglobales bacterium]|nr:PEGA domain-containing protein [Terriglobales bacterium]
VAQPLESERVYLSIFRAADVKRAQGDKAYQPKPVYYTHHESWWTYRKSHHMAMEDALKFLAQAPADGESPDTSEGSQKSAAPSDSQQTGTVTVTSAPDGADVYADGAFVGNAPAILRLNAGKHRVRVAMQGYKGWDRELTVQTGSQLNVKAVLEREN